MSVQNLVKNKTFSLTKLLHDIVNSKTTIKNWQDFEQLVVSCCRKQDPDCIYNKDIDPDIVLTNGFGLEAKSITSPLRGINLNSAPPNPNTFYVVGYRNRTVKHVAIISGANFYSPEIEDLKQINTSLQDLSNAKLRYRTRIMYQITSPFKTWGLSNFIVDKLGKVILC